MWMTRDVITVLPQVPVVEIAKLMAAKNIRRLPVVDAEGNLLGLVSAQDVWHAFPADVNPFVFTAGKAPDAATLKLTAADVMSTGPMTTEPENSIEEVSRLMLEHKLGALLVTRHDKLVGVITESDIFRAFTELFDLGTHGVRITFDNSKGEDALPLIAEATHRHRLRVMSFIFLHKRERPVCVVQVTGSPAGIEAMLEDIWKSHHQVVSVVHVKAKAEAEDKADGETADKQ
jgi:acetoin utilization protein AcuB